MLQLSVNVIPRAGGSQPRITVPHLKHCHQIQPLWHGKTCPFQVYTPLLKGHSAPVSHTGPSWHIPAGAQGRSPNPARTTGGWPRAWSKGRGEGGRGRARARLPVSSREDKVRDRRPRGAGTGHSASERGGQACARLPPGSTPRPVSGLGPPRPPRALTIVVDPGRLQELHCSAAAAAGLRREPRPSARPGHGAAAARAARPPAAARPPPSAPPRHRRPATPAAAAAAADPRARPPPPPPQPHPPRRSSSGGSRATPEVTARTCQTAPAGNRSPRSRAAQLLSRPGGKAAPLRVRPARPRARGRPAGSARTGERDLGCAPAGRGRAAQTASLLCPPVRSRLINRLPPPPARVHLSPASAGHVPRRCSHRGPAPTSANEPERLLDAQAASRARTLSPLGPAAGLGPRGAQAERLERGKGAAPAGRKPLIGARCEAPGAGRGHVGGRASSSGRNAGARGCAAVGPESGAPRAGPPRGARPEAAVGDREAWRPRR